MLTLLAFLVTIGLLVTIHEYGHYRMARACGVKVLRFSIGMGRPLLRWRRPGNETEFVLSALPLGGYVRMLDEREGPVPPQELARAFNRRPLPQRMAIVLAGPLANLLLAVLCFSAVNWWGVQAPQALLATPEADSLAAQAGLRQGDRVLQLRVGQGGRPQAIQSFDELSWALQRAALLQQDVWLQVQRGDDQQELRLPLSALQLQDLDAQALRRIGLLAPLAPPQLGSIQPGSPAAQAGLQPGDIVQAVDDVPMGDVQQLIALLHALPGQAADGLPGAAAAARPVQRWTVLRNGQQRQLQVQPRQRQEGERRWAEVGAYLGPGPATALVRVRYGAWDGLARGVRLSGEMAALTLRMFGRMVLGQASLQNLSGPVSIAQYAGQSARLGMVQFLQFLAVVSLSLGVLNLLPLPILDGGHLIYYLWEAVTGRPVSVLWLERLQALGIAALFMLMALALFNDLARLLS
ncbi:RIP metalloprotease RseP [Vandammella animalimorsus]|uniref:Zinc metalloprotease n=1 Tax=Vandammella animalimorsus TaxID=2029117 RepID=A0A2A2AQV5_9BURK|nr:RIP metalloprotease RseP [Vandammella animalimorsus]PAT40102.1 RIP metalloprotease RseP [Vandammella animalimorsus]